MNQLRTRPVRMGALNVAPRCRSSVVVRALPMDPLPVRTNFASGVKSYLRSQGWENWWIDVVTDKIMKGGLRTSEAQVKEIVEFLTNEVGIPTQTVCSMASITPDMMAQPQANARSVVQYLQRRGLSAEDVRKVLAMHPKLLEYSPQGDVLARSSGSQVKVDVVDGAVNVAYFRSKAIFNTAPITPFAPSH